MQKYKGFLKLKSQKLSLHHCHAKHNIFEKPFQQGLCSLKIMWQKKDRNVFTEANVIKEISLT